MGDQERDLDSLMDSFNCSLTSWEIGREKRGVRGKGGGRWNPLIASFSCSFMSWEIGRERVGEGERERQMERGK